MDPAQWRQHLLDRIVGARWAGPLWTALERDAEAHPQGRASLWPRLGVDFTGGLWVATPGAHAAELIAGAEETARLRAAPARPPLPEDAPWEALMRDAPLPSGWAPEWRSELAWLRSSPFCLPLPKEDPPARVVAWTNPVRAGAGGAAVWAPRSDRFVPLALHFAVARGERADPLPFTLAPHQPDRRPLARVGPYDLFHGPVGPRAHTLLMKASQLASRAGRAAAHHPWAMRDALRAEVAHTRGIVWRGSRWEPLSDA